jgi:hypothetical protein
MKKHPKEVWSIHALLSDIQTKTELDQHEKDFISFLKSQDSNYGYNICRGGEGFTGKFTTEHRTKLSKAAYITRNYLKGAQATRGIPRTPEIKTKISKGNTGKIRSEETLEKLRFIQGNRLNHPHTGKFHSEETKKQISDAKRGCPGTMNGKHHSEESKEKNRKAHIINLKDKQFGNILVVSFSHSSSSAYWKVQCGVCQVKDTIRSDRIRDGDSRFMKTHNSHI